MKNYVLTQITVYKMLFANVYWKCVYIWFYFAAQGINKQTSPVVQANTAS